MWIDNTKVHLFAYSGGETYQNIELMFCNKSQRYFLVCYSDDTVPFQVMFLKIINRPHQETLLTQRGICKDIEQMGLISCDQVTLWQSNVIITLLPTTRLANSGPPNQQY